MEQLIMRRPWQQPLSRQDDLGADLRRRVDCAAAGIVEDLARQGVVGLIAYVSFDFHPVLTLQTATDAQRDQLPLVGCQEVVARRLADQGVLAINSARVSAQSVETVERDFGGDWSSATR